MIRTTIKVTLCALLALVAGECVSFRFTPHVQALPKIAIDPNIDMPPEIAIFVQKSCGDCHTSETHFPWYAHIPPVSWALQHDVEAAHRAVDFTNWSTKNGRTKVRAMATLMAACADLESGRMPLPKYLWMHPDAKPSPGEIKRYCDWTDQESAKLTSHSQSTH